MIYAMIYDEIMLMQFLATLVFKFTCHCSKDFCSAYLRGIRGKGTLFGALDEQFVLFFDRRMADPENGIRSFEN